ncbi:Zn-ribbon domain-containing OB-fold protein [Erythrobacter alti]|uniref:Zn-ribbon domain-containing OB-fold protein n=1 Tax=Erythrobacter alti TaxID=1896145 RepID=UPI0030F47763
MTQCSVVPPETHWRAALADGRFLIQRDPVDGTTYFPPRLAGPKGQSLEWVEASGLGTVYAVSVIYPKPPQQPYNVVLVDLEEGARMMSRVESERPEDIAIGDPVRARIAATDDGMQIVFHPA